MWQLLLAAAVAGSTGFIAKHLFTQSKQCHHTHDDPDITLHEDDNLISQPLGSKAEANSDTREGIFTFCSSQSLRQQHEHGLPKKPLFRRRKSKGAVKIANLEEEGKDGKRLSFCLKKRKTVKNVAGKTGFCSSKGIIFYVLVNVTYQFCLFMLPF